MRDTSTSSWEGHDARSRAAFRQNDFDTAYTFASTTIRDMFDRQAFERMVRAGYPEIASSVSAFVSESVVAPNGGVYLRPMVRDKVPA